MSIKVDLSPDVVVKLKNALEDKAFADLLNSMQTAEEIQNALKEKNVDLTIDEIKGIGEAIRAENSEGELDERELEDVSGGSVVTDWAKKIGRWLGSVYAPIAARRR